MEDYLGTLSAIPNRGRDNPIVGTSPKRERGKVRGNKRNPRSNVVALSDCKVYKSQEDYDAGKVSHTIARNTRTRNVQRKDRAIVEQIRHLTSADLAPVQNYETDA